MNTNEAAITALALKNSKDISESAVRDIMRSRGTLKGLIDMPFEELVYMGLDIKSAHAIAEANLKEAEKEIKALYGMGGYLKLLEDKDYPAYLKEIYDPPVALYFMGDSSCLDALCIAMVGARKTSRIGEDMAGKLATELSSAGVTVVSGFAYGIDICSHIAALKSGGCTAAVLGSGFKHIYPHAHKKYIDDVCIKGCLVSEFPLDEKPAAYNFPKRNRIISGLCRGVVVVEASARSGSLITVRTALEQGRDVFAVPTSPLFTNNATNELIRNGAILTGSAADILSEYSYIMEREASISGEKTLEEGGDKERIYEAVAMEPLTADELTDRLQIGYTGLAAILMEMELEGTLKKGGDGRYTVS